MRWLWSRQPAPENPDPPLGVVLHYSGRAIPCSVLRDPDQDEHGCAAWVAVPGEAVNIRPGESVRLTAAVLPGRTLLLADLGLGADEEAWPGSR